MPSTTDKGTKARRLEPPTPVLRRLALPLAGLALLGVAAGGSALVVQHRRHAREGVAARRAELSSKLDLVLKQQAAGLAATADVAAADPRLVAGLWSADVDGLLATFGATFAQLRAKRDVTHWYFLDARRVCLLRLHQPHRRGDVIDRHTAREAERTSEVASGIELGPLGTFTLRVVRPVRADGVLVGYVELGKEIEDALGALDPGPGAEFAVVIRKALVDRERWVEGMGVLGRLADWDLLDQGVVSYASRGRLPASTLGAVSACLAEASACARSPRDAEGHRLDVEASPLRDASGREVGKLVVVADRTPEEARLRATIWTFGVGTGLAALACVAVVALLLRRTDALVRAQHEALVRAAEEAERTSALLAQETASARSLAVKADEATAAKSRFLAHMSHELRTPMNGVLGTLDLLLDSALSADQRRLAQLASSSATTLLRLLDELLQFSKAEAGKLELVPADFDLLETIEGAAVNLAPGAQRKGLALTCLVEPSVPRWVWGDGERLRQVLTNLLGNAIKFTASGEVTLRASVAGSPAPGAEAVVQFAVLDTGIGIAPEQLEHVFERFSQADASITRRFGGSGLGLAISRQLVRLMGGELRARSEPGVGSEFSFTARLTVRPERGDGLPRAPAVAAARVLVVDRSAGGREALSLALRAWGALPSEATCADEAAEALRRARAEGSPFAMALVDLEDAAVQGERLARVLLDEPGVGAGVRLVALRPLGAEEEPARLRALGVCACVCKPVRRAELAQALAVALDRRSSAERSEPPPAPRAVPVAAPAQEGEEPGAPAPAADGEPARTATSAAAATTPRTAPESGALVLVVEDNRIDQTVTLGILKRMGLAAEIAEDGEQAVRALERKRFDVVLMDIQMPLMDGAQATRIIRDPSSQVLQHDVPIIAVTASAMPQEVASFFQVGMNDYVPKPVSHARLAEAIERWLPPGAGARGGPQASAVDRSGVEASVFDRSAFVASLLGDEPLARQIAGSFVADGPTLFGNLRSALLEGDRERARQCAHTLKGAASAMTAERLRALALSIETQAASGELAAASARVGELEAERRALWAALAAAFELPAATTAGPPQRGGVGEVVGPAQR